jgi:hypothetical protein
VLVEQWGNHMNGHEAAKDADSVVGVNDKVRTAAKRKSYSTPILIEYGPLLALTQGTAGSLNDGQGTMTLP